MLLPVVNIHWQNNSQQQLQTLQKSKTYETFKGPFFQSRYPYYNNLTESVQDLKMYFNKVFKFILHKHKRIGKSVLYFVQGKKGKKMDFTIISIYFGILAVVCIVTMTMAVVSNKHVGTLEKDVSYLHDLIVRMQNVLKTKSATNAVAEHAEIIYQDLLQNLIPILAALDIMPRNTSEHPLWRTLGGLLDEYAKNPFVMEKLRRAIKLDATVKRNVSNYMSRAENLLNHLNATEPDGILATTFINGLLGQSLTFLTQAYQLATTDNDIK